MSNSIYYFALPCNILSLLMSIGSLLVISQSSARKDKKQAISNVQSQSSRRFALATIIISHIFNVIIQINAIQIQSGLVGIYEVNILLNASGTLAINIELLVALYNTEMLKIVSPLPGVTRFRLRNASYYLKPFFQIGYAFVQIIQILYFIFLACQFSIPSWFLSLEAITSTAFATCVILLDNGTAFIVAYLLWYSFQGRIQSNALSYLRITQIVLFCVLLDWSAISLQAYASAVFSTTDTRLYLACSCFGQGATGIHMNLLGYSRRRLAELMATGSKVGEDTRRVKGLTSEAKEVREGQDFLSPANQGFSAIDLGFTIPTSYDQEQIPAFSLYNNHELLSFTQQQQQEIDDLLKRTYSPAIGGDQLQAPNLITSNHSSPEAGMTEDIQNFIDSL